MTSAPDTQSFLGTASPVEALRIWHGLKSLQANHHPMAARLPEASEQVFKHLSTRLVSAPVMVIDIVANEMEGVPLFVEDRALLLLISSKYLELGADADAAYWNDLAKDVAGNKTIVVRSSLRRLAPAL